MLSNPSLNTLHHVANVSRFSSQAVVTPLTANNHNNRFGPNDQVCNLGEMLTGLKVLLATANNTKESEASIKQVLLKAASLLTEKSRELLSLLQKTIQLDGLTQVPNRAAFDRQLEKSLTQAKADKTPLTVAMIDLDHFKGVNDTYGHPVGDLILKRLAEVARNTLRGQGEFFRYGGEEFAFILPNTTQLEAETLLNALRENLSKCNRSSDPPELKQVFEERPVTLSAGMVYHQFTDDEEASAALHPKELLEKADKALYQAKKTGRNRVCVYEDKPETTSLEKAASDNQSSH
jgi:diguanylate cyclase (GGDEF)-like protein